MLHLLLLLVSGLSLISMSMPTRAAEQAVQLDTPTGMIRGTLTVPAGVSRLPVVLIIAGSGPTDRDGNNPVIAGRNDSLKLLAAALADSGFASVRYDKRGIAGSAAAAHDEAALRIEDYVQDAAAWVSMLAEDARFSGVAIVGHSEGSLIGMLAAQRSLALAFVSIAGPAEKAASALRRQLSGRLPPELTERNEAILASLEAGKPAGDVPPQLLVLYRPSVQPYLISWFSYSPTLEIGKLKIPCLILQGETDLQVTVSDARQLHEAGNACQLKLVAGMNHVMKLVPADRATQIASYGNPSLPVAAELTQALTRFLSETMPPAAVGTKPSQ